MSDAAGFELFLQESAKIHGHLCAGHVLGVRMSMLGLRLAGITDPKGADRKNIIVYVEMDRCAADAVQSVTGCSLGRRTLKFMDYGKMAATYWNVKAGKAFRICAREDSRERAKGYFPGIGNTRVAQREAYKLMSDEELFDVMEVAVKPRTEHMPGCPRQRVRCDACGEQVLDMKHVQHRGKVLCKPCAGDGYYEGVNPVCAGRLKFLSVCPDGDGY